LLLANPSHPIVLIGSPIPLLCYFPFRRFRICVDMCTICWIILIGYLSGAVVLFLLGTVHFLGLLSKLFDSDSSLYLVHLCNWPLDCCYGSLYRELYLVVGFSLLNQMGYFFEFRSVKHLVEVSWLVHSSINCVLPD
jgi:hypothetical protein